MLRLANSLCPNKANGGGGGGGTGALKAVIRPEQGPTRCPVFNLFFSLEA